MGFSREMADPENSCCMGINYIWWLHTTTGVFRLRGQNCETISTFHNSYKRHSISLQWFNLTSKLFQFLVTASTLVSSVSMWRWLCLCTKMFNYKIASTANKMRKESAISRYMNDSYMHIIYRSLFAMTAATNTETKATTHTTDRAKMTAQCALCTKIVGSPWLHPRLLFPKFLIGFCSDWAHKCACKICSS